MVKRSAAMILMTTVRKRAIGMANDKLRMAMGISDAALVFRTSTHQLAVITSAAAPMTPASGPRRDSSIDG